MNSRRFAPPVAAAVAAAVLVASPLAASAQRKTATQEKTSTPQSEMKRNEKPRLFVASAAGTNEQWTNDITRQTLEEALVNSNRFEVIAGTQRDNLLAEQHFSNSDLVDPNQATKVGRMLSAKYVVSGTCQSVTLQEKKSGTGGFGGMLGHGGGMVDKASSGSSSKVSTQIQIQMTDLEKGTILATKTYKLDSSSEKSNAFTQRSTDDPKEAAYRQLVATAAQQFVSELSSTVPIEALIASINGGRVILNAGSAAGLAPGMRFEVYSEGEAIKDPATGEILDRTTTKVAVLSIAEVRDRIAYADIVKTWSDGGQLDAAPDPSRLVAGMSARAMSGGGGSAAADNGGGGGKHKNKDN